MFAGVDVGLKACRMAIINDEIVLCDYDAEKLSEVEAVGIDAPLSFPKEGSLRECERKLLALGIRLFPSGANFFKKIALRGMEIASELRAKGIRVYEVYPYASRVMLGIAPEAKKRTKDGLEKIKTSLKRFFEISEASHDDLDAIVAAITVKEFEMGRGFVLKGVDGEIVLPRKS